MKNKKTVYFLLFLTLIIWGIIITRFYSSLKQDAQPLVNNENIVELKGEFVSSDFKIIANYRDPFLGEFKGKENSTIAIANKAIPSTPRKNPSLTQWPSIKYLGSISNGDKKKQIVMIAINGKERIMKQKDLIDGVTLGKIYRDSIEVVYNGEWRYFKR